MTQYNQAHLNHLETKDDMDAGNTRLSKLKEQNEHLLKEIESMGKEHEDLITKLNDVAPKRPRSKLFDILRQALHL